MSDKEDRVTVDFSESLSHLQNQTKQLSDVVERTLQALSKHGVQLSVDLSGMIRGIGQDVNQLNKKSSKVLQQLGQQQSDLTERVGSAIIKHYFGTIVRVTFLVRDRIVQRDKTVT